MRVATVLLVASLSAARLALAASDVSVSVAGGTLRVLGSASTDHITIDQLGIADPHEFRVTPGVGTTVNGSASAAQFGGVKKDIRIAAGGGVGDQFTVADARVPRDLRVTTTGPDTDSMNCTTARCTILHDLRVDASGASILLEMRRARIRDDLRVRGSGGIDQVLFDGIVAVGGDVRVDLRGGEDLFSMRSTHIEGRLDINGGVARDTNIVSDSIVEGPIRLVAADDDTSLSIDASTVASVSMKSGDGADALGIEDSLVLGEASASLGAGLNRIATSDTTFARAARFRSGAGPDDFELGTNTAFERAASFALGDGANTCVANEASFASGARIRVGDDADIVTVIDSACRGLLQCSVGGAPVGMLNSAQFQRSRIDGDLRVTGGAGVDEFVTLSSRIAREVRYALGAGANTGQVIDTRARGIRIEAGSGLDQLLVASDDVVARDVRVEAGGGANQIGIGGTIHGDLRVDAGSGNDALTFDADLLVVGTTKVDLGAGTNSGP